MKLPLLVTNVLFFKQRITIPEIKTHPWFLKNTPEFTEDKESSIEIEKMNKSSQNIEEIISIIQ